ncbi:MAG: ATP phosphoribosyltransferase [Acidipropionibacterium acidipropionici]|jgi:ATP phosphoribosyltransferase|uniref:ATP phosphoribosyltransferase n=2 Tax=Acidipropionibacterium acidipropionici TaxID=1748 RepID=A0A142KF58_9ACTN|nr:ATP phosphoribosyltransferase [Acidipropionibacterium acidipropionici]AFV89886.1 ATP phosphoribosyltransferase [Acidipropionibacterium acidipropionici ATCC 4875]ALN15771.1 ATP phosphoribosyltransferase [Acidipropionibacterium acidipropionici]AMS04746.1 ATP phosphoribosyltransferase [Acidipropionibacterium acidipropionici]AOZ46236.1 ATP phosphoribosyltransferase [Acidipropionibacterium acidipropionici]APZ08485.1 ATP phosphoribosyltransferase [Acidipropionibacterium acidipropionici]
MSGQNVLRIAVPNKGALSEAAASLLSEAGYRQRTDRKDLRLLDEANGVEFFYLRPRDIAIYVGEGTLDLGITGRDLLLDSMAQAVEVRGLGFGRSRFRFAAPAGRHNTVEGLAGRRIATSYPGLLRSYLDERGIDAHLIHLDGAVESSIGLGVADAIADVVETGTTLRKAGLEIFGEVILESEGVLIRRHGFEAGSAYEHFMKRIEGVQVARSYVMLDYDVPEANLAAASDLTPGLEAPTVSPLSRQGWYAVRAMVPRGQVQTLMDQLWDAGARAILSTDIAACRI